MAKSDRGVNRVKDFIWIEILPVIWVKMSKIHSHPKTKLQYILVCIKSAVILHHCQYNEELPEYIFVMSAAYCLGPIYIIKRDGVFIYISQS